MEMYSKTNKTNWTAAGFSDMAESILKPCSTVLERGEFKETNPV